ncbi:hypothetical protein [Streptomyces sp. NPDC052494]|uniref:hypothetical protein n=1 Tax=Streptomyces sp. NPDC052494 TaxID=3365692 RepID=UPI0037D4F12B
MRTRVIPRWLSGEGVGELLFIAGNVLGLGLIGVLAVDDANARVDRGAASVPDLPPGDGAAHVAPDRAQPT